MEISPEWTTRWEEWTTRWVVHSLDLPEALCHNMFMEIQKPNLRTYDSRHLQAVRSETARSIKPNVFREVPEEVQLALWLTDLVELSPEARLLLKKLRNVKGALVDGGDWLSLLEALESLRETLVPQEKGKKKGEDSHLNLVTLPVMRPPLPEVLPRDRDGKNKKSQPQSPVRQLLSRMVAISPSGGIKEKLLNELSPLGVPVVRACKEFGVRVVILGEGERLSELRVRGMALIAPGERAPDGRLKDEIRGMYFEDRRLVVLGAEQIGIPGRLTSVHEFAHAYDHTFSESHHRKHHLSTQLWNLFAKNRTAFVTAYASTQPAEYFAESVEAYFLREKRPLLKTHDPQMLEFLENLFSLRG